MEKRRSRWRDVFCIRKFELCSIELGIAAILSSCHTMHKNKDTIVEKWNI